MTEQPAQPRDTGTDSGIHPDSGPTDTGPVDSGSDGNNGNNIINASATFTPMTIIGSIKADTITGGSGSLGRALIQRLTADCAERIVTFSRDEQKRAGLKRDFGDHQAAPPGGA